MQSTLKLSLAAGLMQMTRCCQTQRRMSPPVAEDADADLAALEQDDLAGLEQDLGDRVEDLLAASDPFDFEALWAGPRLGIRCTRG